MKIIFFFIVLFWYGFVFCEESSRKEYVIQPQLDIPLTVSAAMLALYGSYRLNEMELQDKIVKKSDLLIWDRPWAGVWHPNADLASDVLSVFAITPLAIGVVSYFKDDIKGSEFGALTLMLLQTMAIQSGLNLMVRSTQLWPRPYIFSENGGDARFKGEAYGSFYSGHASAAFSVAVLTSTWFQNTYSSSKYIPYLWATSLSLATTVSVLRVVAGKHYPTDVIAGALMGTLVSISVLKIHEHQSPSLSIQVGPNYLGVTRHF